MRDGIRVVGVNPGPVATERITALMGTREGFEEHLASLPPGRIAAPREIADMTAFLASDRSAYTSGVIVTVDGGLCASTYGRRDPPSQALLCDSGTQTIFPTWHRLIAWSNHHGHLGL